MPASPARVYLDSNVLLAYVAGAQGRADAVRAVLEASRGKEIEVLTSVLSITEVAYAAQERDAGLTEEAEDSIDKLWEPASPITLVAVSERLTFRARGLIRQARQKGIRSLRSADALHLASATQANCSEVFTYEAEATRRGWSSLIGIPVNEPAVDQPTLPDL